MARRDEILKAFLSHEILTDKYELRQSTMPTTVRDALNSTVPIIKAIAIIVDGLDMRTSTTDKQLSERVNRYLNTVL